MSVYLTREVDFYYFKTKESVRRSLIRRSINKVAVTSLYIISCGLRVVLVGLR